MGSRTSHSSSLYTRLMLWAILGSSLLITLAESASFHPVEVPSAQATPKRPCLAQGLTNHESQGWGDSPPRRTGLYDFDRLSRTWSNPGLLGDWNAHQDGLRRREDLANPRKVREESGKLHRSFSEMSYPPKGQKRLPITDQGIKTRSRGLSYKRVLRATRRTRQKHVATLNPTKTATKLPKRPGSSKRPSQIFSSVLKGLWRWFRSVRDAVASFKDSSLVRKYFSIKHELTAEEKKGIIGVFKRDIKHRKVVRFLTKFEKSQDSQEKSQVITAEFEILLARKRIGFREGYAWIQCFAYISKPAAQIIDVKIGLELQWGLINLTSRFGFPAKRRKMHVGLLESIEVLSGSLRMRLDRERLREGTYESLAKVPWAFQLLYPEQGTKILLALKDNRQLIEGWLKQDKLVSPYFEVLQKSSSASSQQTLKVVKDLGDLARNYNEKKDTQTSAQTKTAAVVLLQYFYQSAFIADSPFIKQSSEKFDTHKEVYDVLLSLTSWHGVNGNEEKNRFFQEELITADMPLLF